MHEALDGRVAVASGADRRKVELQLAKVGIADCFEGRIFSGQELARSKPYPDVYLKAAEVLGVDPRRCAVVEDTLTGASSGLAAGATVFAYSSLGADGHLGAQLLRDAGVAHVFSDMEQLPTLLSGWRSTPG
ncbi:MAG: family phosphatase [Labilithrix sp.]|nr:family phosphatase [Labilithrix sp.]